MLHEVPIIIMFSLFSHASQSEISRSESGSGSLFLTSDYLFRNIIEIQWADIFARHYQPRDNLFVSNSICSRRLGTSWIKPSDSGILYRNR